MIFPEPGKMLGFPPPVSGGWIYTLASLVGQSAGIKLNIAANYGGDTIQRYDINGICYYLMPYLSRYSSSKSDFFWQELCSESNPDIVHIQGTEWTPGLSCIKACPALNYIVSIQGLIGLCKKYYFAGISRREIIKNITLRDIVKGDTLFQSQRKFEIRGRQETEILQKTQHIIGRTSWDYAHVKSINPKVRYHFCNEILRDSFYTASKWEIRKIIPNSIFLSQATYPIKGLHQVIKAVALLKKEFPDLTVRVAGQNITDMDGFWKKLKISGYGSYIRKLLKECDLQNQLIFTGILNEEEMVSEYQHANLFISPSSIENSSNSVGEAQLIGTPTIASFVGGIPDLIIHGKSGLLYQFEEVEMLAENIRQVFSDNNLANHLSGNEIEAASKRHNRQTNLSQTISIYKEVLAGRSS